MTTQNDFEKDDVVVDTEEDTALQTFDISEIDSIAIGRSGGSSMYAAVREVCDDELLDVQKGKGVLVRAVVKKIRSFLMERGDEDPGYQPVCVRLRNYVASSKLKYRLVTNAHKVSFIIKK